MKKNLYSMFDKTANAYMAPLQIETDAEAIRLFTTWVNADDKTQNISMYPEQFSLWRVGTLDVKSGKLEDDRKELISGNACKTEEKTYTIKDIIHMIGDNS